ncbi:MAG TPA: hypothetical protein VIV12_20535, partial [Streptosporangiaceae bacterium]
MTGGDRTIVVKLRVRAQPGRDSAPARVATALSSARARPGTLPPAAVLVVRHLADPSPSTLQAYPPQPAPPAWEHALRTALDRAVAAAARPAAGPVPATAQAVRFEDRAELLACLASDWLAGVLWSRWWWRWLLGSGRAVDAVPRAWLASPRYVPAALKLLARRGEAVALARHLPPPFAAALLREVVGAFTVAGRDSSSQPAGRPHDPGRPAPAAALAAAEPPAPARTHPWQALIPEANADGLSSEQRLLLSAGLLLGQAPALGRDPSCWPTVHGRAPSPPERPAARASGVATRPDGPARNGSRHPPAAGALTPREPGG